MIDNKFVKKSDFLIVKKIPTEIYVFFGGKKP